jgi:hypothetical protein
MQIKNSRKEERPSCFVSNSKSFLEGGLEEAFFSKKVSSKGLRPPTGQTKDISQPCYPVP